MLKKALPAAIAASLLAGAAAVQAYEISGNVALTTDYRFRGISQSDESAAIQGGFDLGFENGIYVGTWGSSVDFGDEGTDGSYGSLELDYYAGFAIPIGDNMGIDVGYIYYDYPGDTVDPKGDYQEIYGKFSLWDLTLGINYSDDYYGKTGDFFYYSADYSLGLGDTFSLDLHAAYNDLDKEGFLFDETSYWDYSVGLNASWLAVDWTLAYVGTNLDDENVFGSDWADDTVVLTVSKSL